MSTARHHGERLGACTDCRRFWARYRAGEVDAEQIRAVETRLASTSGTCAVMGTASTMASLAEAMGLMPSYGASIPAVDADRLRMAEATGRAAVSLIGTERSFARLLDARVLENALRVLLAIGGSTNAVLHMAAIAGRLGLEVDLKRFNELSDTTPGHRRPQAHRQPLYGGPPRRRRHPRGASRAERDPASRCADGDGRDAWASGSPSAHPWVDRNVIHSVQEPVRPDGGLVALFGSLAPRGAILKRSAADPKLFEREGRAVVFDGLADLAARIDDPSLDVTPDDFLVLKNAGPSSGAAMPEAGYLPIPTKLARAGMKDMVRISDARMSGTAFGTIVLHVAPDAASGGPLAVVESGDRIRLRYATADRPPARSTRDRAPASGRAARSGAGRPRL